MELDVKVLQYIMGHAHIDVTMDVYNHVSEMSRIESEITRLEKKLKIISTHLLTVLITCDIT